jgi:hypothetical protein
MAKNGGGKTASKRSARRKQADAEMQVQAERYTPLLSRERFTFSRMRIGRDGPRTYSAICFPGWVRA